MEEKVQSRLRRNDWKDFPKTSSLIIGDSQPQKEIQELSTKVNAHIRHV